MREEVRGVMRRGGWSLRDMLTGVMVRRRMRGGYRRMRVVEREVGSVENRAARKVEVWGQWMARGGCLLRCRRRRVRWWRIWRVSRGWRRGGEMKWVMRSMILGVICSKGRRREVDGCSPS